MTKRKTSHYIVPAAAALLVFLALACGIYVSIANEHGTVVAQRLGADGQHRPYRLHLPSTYDGSQRTPLVMVLHSNGHSAEFAGEQARFDHASQRHGFIAVYPEAQQQAWRPGDAELAYLNGLLDFLKAGYAIDDARVYVVGLGEAGETVGAMAAAVGGRAEPVPQDQLPIPARMAALALTLPAESGVAVPAVESASPQNDAADEPAAEEGETLHLARHVGDEEAGDAVWSFLASRETPHAAP